MNVNRIVRKSLVRYGDKGWKWAIEYHDPYTGDIEITEYRTNEAGTGLWSVGSYTGPDAGRYQDTQLRGTCQFSLCGLEYARARRAIYRYHCE